MFIGLSKTLARFGGFRLGVGLRLTKSNMYWMAFLIMFINILKATWYIMVICFWLIYAICYGLAYGCKKLIKKLRKDIKKEGEQA